MKKIVFGLFVSLSFCLVVEAFQSKFNIDIDKINVTSRSDNLIDSLDKSYDIDTKDFSNEIVSNKEVEDLTKKLIEISLSDKTVDEKNKLFSDYLYIDKSNGVNSLTSSLFIKTFLDSINKYKIKYDYIKVIRVVKFEMGLLSFAYLPQVEVDGKMQDLVLTYWFKENEGTYQVHYAWFSVADDLENYFDNLGKNEDLGTIIGGSFKSISLSGNQVTVTDDVLNKLYSENVDSSYQITGMHMGGSNMYGSAFTIRSGVVVTTWSLFIKFLSESQHIFVNDSKGNTYQITGIIAADTNYDVVILKLDNEVGKAVKFGNPEDLKLDDKLFTINSKVNTGFSINYGSFISYEKGKLNNLFALSSSDVGSALYNINGEVVGFNTADILNSDLSYANGINYIKELQNILNNTNFNDIKYKDLNTFKETYYQPLEEEIKYSNVSESKLDKYLSIGNLKKNITLPLIKSSYKDKVLSLRYKNSANESLSTMYLVNDYISDLENQGYKNVYDTSEKKIYENNKYQIIIKENMDYLIILIAEV